MQSSSDGLTHAQRAAMGATDGDNARGGLVHAGVSESASDRRTALSGMSARDAMLAMKTILARAASLDGKERDDYAVQSWCEALAAFDPQDIQAAVLEHYRRSTFPVMPANVISIIEEG